MAAIRTKDLSDNARGALNMLTGVFLFTVMEAMVKWLVADYPVHQIIFFRSAFALIPCDYFVWRAGGMATLRTRRSHIHLMRGAIGLAAMGCYFLAYSQMALADAKAILFSAPLFMTILAIPLLGERVGIYRWSAVLVGLAGVLIILNPGSAMLQIGTLAAVGGAIFYALAVITVRHLGATESVASITFYFTLIGAVASAGLVGVFGWITPTPGDLAMLVAIGLIGGVGQYAMTRAFRLAETAAIAPLDYTSMAWAILLGYLIWGDVPSLAVFAGITLVVASGLFILYREQRMARIRPSKLPRLR